MKKFKFRISNVSNAQVIGAGPAGLFAALQLVN
jgi:thioredoxin reductase